MLVNLHLVDSMWKQYIFSCWKRRRCLHLVSRSSWPASRMFVVLTLWLLRVLRVFICCISMLRIAPISHSACVFFLLLVQYLAHEFNVFFGYNIPPIFILLLSVVPDIPSVAGLLSDSSVVNRFGLIMKLLVGRTTFFGWVLCSFRRLL